MAIIPEQHQAQLGTCAFDDDVTAETGMFRIDSKMQNIYLSFPFLYFYTFLISFLFLPFL